MAANNTDEKIEVLGRLFPRNYTRKIGKTLQTAGLTIGPEYFIGLVILIMGSVSIFSCGIVFGVSPVYAFLNGLLSSILAPLKGTPVVLEVVKTLLMIIIAIVCAISVVLMIIYIAITFWSEDRKNSLEKYLPDFLQLSAANARSGMSVDQAIWYAAKPEFGLLAKEVDLVARRAFSGESFTKSLDMLNDRFESRQLRRTVSMIKQGLATGGEISNILENIAHDARINQQIRKEISASLIMYMIFIAFAVIIGTPFLFGVSGKLIELLYGAFCSLPSLQNIPSSFIKPSPPAIKPSEFSLFAIFVSVLSTFSASLMIGAIQKMNKWQGLRYFPIVLTATIVMYLIVGLILEFIFKSISYKSTGSCKL